MRDVWDSQDLNVAPVLGSLMAERERKAPRRRGAAKRVLTVVGGSEVAGSQPAAVSKNAAGS